MRRVPRLFPVFLCLLSACVAAGFLIPTARAANGFGDGDLVIYRVGDGTAPLGSAATPVFLDEYTPAGVFVQSIPLPTTAAGANRRLTASGSATSEGLLTRSADGRYLVATGYDAAAGTATVASTTSATVNRVIARVDAAGVLDTTTALTDAVTGGSPRSAVSTNGADLWISGAAGGIRFATLGATTSAPVATTVTNLRQAQIFAGQLFVSSASGSLRLGTVGTGTPTAAGQSITNLPGFPTSTGSPYSFWFADLSPLVDGLDTVYVADDGSAQNGGGVQKYSLISGAWFLNGIVAPAGVRGLTGAVANGVVTLYATTGTALVTITDNAGYGAPIGGAPTTLLTAPANVAFRGVAFAPAAVNQPPAATNPIGVGAATPNTFTSGSTTTLSVAVTNGTNPDSTNLVVTADLSALGGSASQQLFDDGVAPDGTAGDLTFSTSAAITASPGAYSIPFMVSDAQARSAAGTIAITVQDAAAPPAVAISQIYGGGGNAGATLRNDFIELFNRGATAVNLAGWSVQYTSAAGTTWQATPLSGMLQPNQYYLVQENAGTGGSTSLPAPDATGVINMSATAGKVALVETATPLSGACPANSSIVDFVGFGSSASCFEGTGPAGGPGNTTAARRTGGSGGCTDTNDNANDFFTGAPVPRNTAVVGQCTGDTATPLAIHDIQGAGNFSAYADQLVSTTGVVTARKTNGFYLQALDTEVDNDPNTSEGIFVFTSTAPPAAATPGTYVGVTATVQEFIPSADPLSPSVTELIRPTLNFAIAGFALPAATEITAADTTPTSGIFNLEKYEGMRVSVPALTVIAPTGGAVSEANATSASNGVFYGVITQTPALARPVREPGIQIPDPLPPGAPASIPRYDADPERIRVDSDGLAGGTAIDVTTGAVVTGLVGPLDYSFRSYTLLPEPTSPPIVTGGIAAIPVSAAGLNQFTVASANMERFFDTVDDAGISDVRLTDDAFTRRLNKASLMIRTVMRMPDIIGIEEMENVTTLRAVAAKVNADEIAAGHASPQYQAILLEGNDIGGIDVGVLYKSGRVTVDEGSIVQIGKDTTYVEPGGAVALLNDRPSLLVNTSVHVPGAADVPLTLIVNHLRSLSGVDDPADGNRVRHKRQAQAEFLASYLQSLQSADPARRIVLVGDFNAFAFNDGYVDVIGTIKGTPTPADQVTLASADLVDPDLIDLVETAPADQQYSFVFDGTAQELDHVLVTQNLLAYAPHLEYARNNADFPEVYRSDANRPERLSDHDPIVAYFSVPLLTTLTYTGVTSVEAGSPAAVSAVLTDRITQAPIAGETVTFTGPGATASAITDAAGSASATLALPLGSHAVTVTFAGDPSRLLEGSTATATIAVVDTTPPAIASVTPSPSSLWPPTKAMRPVAITVAAADGVDPAVACRVTSITSNEGTAADRTIAGPLSVALRADRNGSGSGRIYTITVGCRDASGNTSTASTRVVVPHDRN